MNGSPQSKDLHTVTGSDHFEIKKKGAQDMTAGEYLLSEVITHLWCRPGPRMPGGERNG